MTGELPGALFGCVNLLAFLLMGWDKRQARRGGWRVSERTLLLAAALFGAAGELAGMLLFRHKTRKPRFLYGLPALFAAQIALAWLLFAR